MNRAAHILLVDADDSDRVRLRDGLHAAGFDVTDAGPAEVALRRIGSLRPDVVLAAAEEAPGGDVGALVALVRDGGSDAPLVVLVPSGSLAPAVEAMRAGAESFLVRPVEPSQAAAIVEKVLEKQRLRRERQALREQVRRRQVLVGSAPELLAVQEVVRRAGPTKATVLVIGESGTGREMVAQAIHEASPRRDRPFVRVSCAAVSQSLLESELFGHEAGGFAEATRREEGRIAAADGGTLFLDEVGQLPQAVQVRLLRVLQHGELERVGGAETLRADVRVVAANHRDLAAEVASGSFRDDLYYRLNIVTLSLPPLRKRKGDIPALVEHFLSRSAAAREKRIRGITPGALSALFAYDWPGNVRELASAIDRAVAVSDGGEIGAEHLSPVLLGARAEERAVSALIPGATLFEIEREAILRTLDEVGGSTTRAAEVLGVSVRKIQYRLKEYKSGHSGRRPTMSTAG